MRFATSAILLSMLLAIAHFAGWGSIVAALVLAISAIAIGCLLDRRRNAAPLSRLIGGLAVIASCAGWLLPLPIHSWAAWLGALSVVIALNRRYILEQCHAGASWWKEIATAHPAWFFVVLLALALASIGLWLPSVNFDDNATHLLLPDQLLAVGYARLDVSSNVASVSPWLANVLHSIATLLAGGEARAAVNLLWLVLGVTGAWRLAVALGGDRIAASAAAILYCSHPLTAYWGTTMQVDGVNAAVLMHLAADLISTKGCVANIYVTGAMLGLLAGLKASNVFYVIPAIGVIAATEIRDGRWRRLMGVGLVAIAVGGSSYFYATVVTGNPLFPFYNAIFKSPYFGLWNFHDERWNAGISWDILWRLTFHTDKYAEMYPGAAGVALLAMLPGLAAEIFLGRRGRWLAFWFLASGLLVFYQVQYLRYIFPSIAVLATVGMLGWRRMLPRPIFGIVVVLLLVSNVLLLPRTSWITYAGSNPWKRLMEKGPSELAQMEREKAPVRWLLGRMYASSPAGCFLVASPSQPYVAGVGGRANAMAWYDPQLNEAWKQAVSDPSGAKWEEVLNTVGATHVVFDPNAATGLINALTRRGFSRVTNALGWEAWANPSAHCDGQFQKDRDQARKLRNLWRGDAL